MAKDQQSIHPRVVAGKTVQPIINTCANSSLQRRMTKQLAGIEKHLESNPRDGLSQTRVSTIRSILKG